MGTSSSFRPSLQPATLTTSADQIRWTKHVPALDGLRGLAILLVMAHNFNLLDGASSAPGKVTELALNFGWVGVQLFFVLSGFLITNILLSTRDSSNYFRSFFGRRAVRIFPLYFIALGIGLVLIPLITGTALEGSENQVWLWTYLSNWAAPLGHEVELYPHMWSLAVEEQFYLVWPFVVYFMSRRGLLSVCLTLTAVALLTRIGIRATDMDPEAAYMFTICRIDAIALGAIASLALRRGSLAILVDRKRTLIRWSLVALTVLTFVATKGAPRTGLLTQTYGYSLFAIIFAVLVLDIALSAGNPRDRLTQFLSFAPLRRIGTYSYAAYVLHKPLHALVGLPLVRRITGGEAPSLSLSILYFALLTGATIWLAYLSYHAIEKHFLALKRHFAISRKPAQ